MTLNLPRVDASGRARRVLDAVMADGLVEPPKPTEAGTGAEAITDSGATTPASPVPSPPSSSDWALLLRNPSNIRWLTGFAGSNGWVVLTPSRLVLVTDGRYEERAGAECAAVGVPAEILVGRSAADLRQHVIDVTSSYDVLAAEAQYLTHQQWTELDGEIPLIPGRRVIEQLRRRKDEAEVARIAAAAEIASSALALVAPMLADEPTEADVRDELDYRMRRLGADGPSYDTIVASGPDHAARPHHEPAARTIRHGDTVIIDVGALVDGYHSDMTRTFVDGDPSGDQLDRYRAVLAAQNAGLEAVVAGHGALDLDAVCRESLAAAGLGEWFVHGTGHGVGLDIHEDPFVTHSTTSDVKLIAGDVVTVEPGVYHAGFGGIRIEDLVVVTDDGCRILTDFPKDTPCLPSRPMT